MNDIPSADNPPASNGDPSGGGLPTIGATTAKYLDDRAAESFKRQTDLEESIWRSLPLLTGGLLAGGAIVTSAAADLPPMRWQAYSVALFGTLGIATIAFGVSFWWLWQVVKPRDFDYPADDEAIARYASEMMEYHAGQGLEKQALDDEVIRELRLYMASTFALASKSTLSNNQARLSARGQVLVFLLSGFLLAFACDAIIFGRRLSDWPQSMGAPDHGTKISDVRERDRQSGARAAIAASDASHPRRGMVDQVQHGTPNPEQVSGRGREADVRCIRPAQGSGGPAASPSATESEQDRTR